MDPGFDLPFTSVVLEEFQLAYHGLGDFDA
jgi:hypothetical protein